ncbi:transcriptional regulator [Colwellia sp. 75C3]|uniref:helix-turn-helix domain-containing protein n=1 Tax=Colwellia sp. 75C3 TaxID=888425 RepID=UPI000C34BCB5|nr:transcriptional regulator [Colwellia sp. 75C3]PKG81879.1 transcriptional regulator [Colwellia sp. 75C3]
MITQKLISLGQELQEIMPFSNGIQTRDQYSEAIKMIDVLVGDAERNDLLINYLFPIIERYEATAPEFKKFNAKIDAMNMGQTVLRILMDHHILNTTHFAEEIGSEISVSLIANGKRQLTTKHINKLSKRFGISPAVFFD